jgi:hypothetical protein
MPLIYDGMRYSNMNGVPGGALTIWTVNTGSVQEFTMEVGAQSADVDVSGLRSNAIPKEGGNAFHWQVVGSYTNDRLQSENLSSDVIARGLTGVPKVAKIWDFNPAGGGPIKADKLWFFSAFMSRGVGVSPWLR